MSNPVAAMPSLHSAFALLVVAFFFNRVRKRWLPLLIAYPIAMATTLAYTGEHYIVDALVGWAYVGLVFLFVGLGELWWQDRRERQVFAAAEAVAARRIDTMPAAEAVSVPAGSAAHPDDQRR
jgi:membrane-associated phospholipid phosphatase